jgi:3-oxoacyl-[acyl-carrier protein] reductase
MQSGLEGKIALVTAASKGLGKASALALAREGCSLAICSRDADTIEWTAAEIRAETGRPVLAMQADLTHPNEIDQLVAATLKAYGRIDILVSNTGGPPPGRFTDVEDTDWQRAFDSLLMPAVRLTRAVLPGMQAQGSGRILYITSGSVKQPIPNLILSNALRAAVTAMMKTLATQVAGQGITANCVAPGRIDTDRVQELDTLVAAKTGETVDQVRLASSARIPAGRYGRPAEFANAILFLASEAASYITGTTMVVDGGQISTLL